MSETENFDVVYASKNNEDTVILTVDKKGKKWLAEAFDKYDSRNRQYSAYLSDGGSVAGSLTPELIELLADSPQSNLRNVLQINNIVRKQINKNDLIGITASSIENNVNTNFKLSYRDFSQQRNKQKTSQKVRNFIDDFNEQIHLRKIIRNSIPLTYNEGTYCMYLRNKEGNFVIDYYPLGVAVVSDYEVNGEPILLINIKELVSRLRKTMIKSKKGKALFFETVEKEILANYPKEVYDAYIAKEDYAILDIRYSGILRIGNLNKKYGLSPIFRALSPILMLDTFEAADRVNTKAKAKKIIVQKLREKLLGNDGDKDAFEEMAYAHENLMEAWKMPTVVVTPPAYVDSIEYVEPSNELTNVDIVNQYRNRVMTCLGIGFLSQEGKQTVSTANISVDQLMLTINKISEQLEDIFYKWYANILQDCGFDKAYAPSIKIIDSEQMSFDVKKSLVELLYSKMGASYKTSFEILGISVEDEKQRREEENNLNYNEIFSPHLTSYTSSGDSLDTGRPKDETPENPDKQNYDKEKNGGKK